jgi:Ca2+-binding RTX toxin-like protein
MRKNMASDTLGAAGGQEGTVKVFHGASAGLATVFVTLLVASFAGAVDITGTPGADLIVGTSGADDIRARGGADEVRARSGGDLVSAGAGGDTVRAGDGKDSVFGEDGDDLLIGGSGRDLFTGGGGDDVVRGGPGGDQVGSLAPRTGMAGNDVYWGGRGIDVILEHGSGDDVLRGGPSRRAADAFFDREFLDPAGGADRVFGGGGPDFVQLRDDGSRDIVRCGPGDDVVDYVAAQDPLDRLFGCEDVR